MKAKKQVISGLFSLFSVLCFGQSVEKTMLRLPDTGQTAGYTATFGEDADYVIHPPFLVDNGNGTVTDTVTGLMWQKTDGGEMTIENAGIYVDALKLGGFTDWRLPSAHESFSILNHQFNNPALDGSVFTATEAEYWWSATFQVNDANRVWVTNAGGGIGNHPKSETISAGGAKKMHVRAVRDVLPLGTVPSHFTDNGDSTITDHLTGLVWQKFPFPDSLTWEQALNYAENLSLAGHNDWRMPNIKEMQSVNDENLMNPSLNPTYFVSSGVRKYWSSTSLPNQTTRAWYLDNRFGITTYALKTQKCNLFCVRGPESTTTKTSDIDHKNDRVIAYPNPFFNRIYLKNLNENRPVALVNLIGEIVFMGKNIEKADFSKLPSGVYFLKIAGDFASPFRLIKI